MPFGSFWNIFKMYIFLRVLWSSLVVWTSLVAQTVKNLPAIQETSV